VATKIEKELPLCFPECPSQHVRPSRVTARRTRQPKRKKCVSPIGTRMAPEWTDPPHWGVEGGSGAKKSKKSFLYVFQNAHRSTFGPRGSPPAGRASPKEVLREPEWAPEWGCLVRICGKKKRNSASSMFSRMPFAARPALAGHRQADAPAQTQFRVTEDSANGARVQMCQNEGHRDASQYNISSM
jgi:hypothetical protein